MVAGDAAMMNKPFSGEGVTSAFTACVIAVEVASRALGSDDVTRESLWEYNVRYFRDQGAKFAFLTAALPALMSISAEEMDFFFEIPGILTEEGSLALQRDYVVKSDPGAALGAVPAVIKGLARGKLRPSTLLRVGRGALVASFLTMFYERYPADSTGFGAWLRIASPLWRKVDEARHRYFTGIL
jgi:flavin-dependent dehydrogenase